MEGKDKHAPDGVCSRCGEPTTTHGAFIGSWHMDGTSAGVCCDWGREDVKSQRQADGIMHLSSENPVCPKHSTKWDDFLTCEECFREQIDKNAPSMGEMLERTVASMDTLAEGKQESESRSVTIVRELLKVVGGLITGEEEPVAVFMSPSARDSVEAAVIRRLVPIVQSHLDVAQSMLDRAKKREEALENTVQEQCDRLNSENSRILELKSHYERREEQRDRVVSVMGLDKLYKDLATERVRVEELCAQIDRMEFDMGAGAEALKKERGNVKCLEAHTKALNDRWRATINLIESLRAPLGIPPDESTDSVEFRRAANDMRHKLITLSAGVRELAESVRIWEPAFVRDWARGVLKEAGLWEIDNGR